jgi:pseudaminic acid cytidylyltransferase
MRLAIIPARGGSKRILHKNIKNFLGKPIIAYSIELAKKSGLFDRIIVSTDCPKIAEVAKAYGAEVPFVRPAVLSDDYTSILTVVAHAVAWVIEQRNSPGAVCCIQATAPLIQEKYLLQGLSLLNESDICYAFSACEFSYPIFRSFKITSEQRIEMFFPEYYDKRSQDLEKSFHDAGQFYWGEPEAFLEQRRVFASWSTPVILPHYLVQDIDTEDDWKRAELAYQWAKTFTDS